MIPGVEKTSNRAKALRKSISWLRVSYIVAGITVLAVTAHFTGTDALGPKEYGTALLALFGTFAGAVLAYQLGVARESAKVKRERVTALNKATFVLGMQYNTIAQLHNQFAEYREGPVSGLNMPRFAAPNLDDIRQNYADLSFLIEFGELDLLFELILEQQRFDQALLSIEVRNDFVEKCVTAPLDAAKKNSSALIVGEIIDTIGEAPFKAAINMGNQIFVHLDGSMKSIPEALRKLHSVAARLFPRQWVPSFEKAECPAEKANAAADETVAAAAIAAGIDIGIVSRPKAR